MRLALFPSSFQDLQASQQAILSHTRTQPDLWKGSGDTGMAIWEGQPPRKNTCEAARRREAVEKGRAVTDTASGCDLP